MVKGHGCRMEPSAAIVARPGLDLPHPFNSSALVPACVRNHAISVTGVIRRVVGLLAGFAPSDAARVASSMKVIDG
jgi:hypothetical protein